MDSLAVPIERVVEASEWFIRTPSIRLLFVATSQVIRAAVLQHITATELLECNTAPFFVLEAPTELDDDGWSLRIEELRADASALIAEAPAELGWPPLWPEQRAATARERFVLELAHALASLRPPATELVITLAPVWVRDGDRWRADLTELLRRPELSRARFIVVEAEQAEALAVMQALHPAAELVDARVDQDAATDEMQARVEAMAAAPPGTTGPQLTGAAGPAIAPPPRKRAPPVPTPAQREAQAAALGISPALLDLDAMHRLRVLVLSASTAMADGDTTRAIATQRQARDFCYEQKLEREGVINELVLGSYTLQAGGTEQAIGVFEAARERARGAGLGELAVHAQMSVGSSLLVLRRVDDAIAAYAEAGRLGAELDAVVLTIEAQRMCGQLLASQGRDAEASAAFRQALATAEGSDESALDSTAPEAARALAELCRKHGLHQQADALEAQAAAMEATTEATTETTTETREA